MKVLGVLALLLFLAVAAPLTSYQLVGWQASTHGYTGLLTLTQGTSQYGADISPLRLVVTFETNERLRVTISDAKNPRWQVPAYTLAEKKPNSGTEQSAAYRLAVTKSPFSLTISRKENNEVIFDSNVNQFGSSNLVFKDQYIELSTVLPQQSAIYGLAEHVNSLRLPKRTYTLWTIDNPDPENQNLYGSHPVYLDVRQGGKSHAVFLHNSNGMDVDYGTMSSGAKDRLTFKAIGGILDMYILMGPEPERVIEQYTSLVGKPYFPPYWSLGFHQCRFGYKNVDNLREVVKGYRDANIPLETMWTDIDYMQDHKDFTFDKNNFPAAEMKKFVDELHNNGQKYTLIVDPGIKIENSYSAYEQGNKYKLWTMMGNTPFTGKVWPGEVVFADWFHPNATSWWTESNREAWNAVPFDGMWIDMNELSNFCDGDCRGAPKQGSSPDYNFPPYTINNRNSKKELWRGTLDMNARHFNGVPEYNVHNLHGYMEMKASTTAMEAIRGERALIISRSSFAGSGRHGGHWLGDNYSSWKDLYFSIPGSMTMNLVGIPMVGSDICGFGGDTTEELCARWIQVGAFTPFSRDHNSYGQTPQELYRWASVAKNARTVLNIRYALLPYYYTLFYNASHGNGGTVMRPLFFEFPGDTATLSVDQQFMIGSGLLFTPVLQEKATQVSGYFPSAALWYDYYTFAPASSGQQTLNTPLDKINIHIKGGTIIPRQGSGLVLRDAQKTPFDLLVAADNQISAFGSLYLDDGKSINVTSFTLVYFQLSRSSTGYKLISEVKSASFKPDVTLNTVRLLGVNKPTRLNYNGRDHPFSYDDSTHSLLVINLNQSLTLKMELQWS